jgi:hypothetical protein
LLKTQLNNTFQQLRKELLTHVSDRNASQLFSIQVRQLLYPATALIAASRRREPQNELMGSTIMFPSNV